MPKRIIGVYTTLTDNPKVRYNIGKKGNPVINIKKIIVLSGKIKYFRANDIFFAISFQICFVNGCFGTINAVKKEMNSKYSDSIQVFEILNIMVHCLNFLQLYLLKLQIIKEYKS
jgi:hypothetical protein